LVASEEDCILSSNDISLQDNVTIYPNPVKESLNFNTPNNLVINALQIYNSLGKQVLQVSNPKNKINVSNLPSGILFVQIITNEGLISEKIIKE